MIVMLKIGVIGSGDTVVGFKALGLDIFPVDDAAAARKLLRELTREGNEDQYAILYLEERIAAELKPEIDHFKSCLTPAIILIPGRDGPIGLGQSALQSAVEKAVGSNIL